MPAHAADCNDQGCIGRCFELPAIRLAPRPQRIEAARDIIADLLVPDDGDQLDAEVTTPHESPDLVAFTVQVPDEARLFEMALDVSEALLNAGFGAVVFGDPVATDGAVRVAIHVRVGAP